MPYTMINPAEMMSPACCRICRAVDNREWFIDLGYSEDWWGSVYYCSLCFDELAGAGGYMRESKLVEYREDYNTMLEMIKDGSWELNNAVDLFQSVGIDFLAFYRWIRAVAAGEVAVEFPERKKPVGSGKNRTNESGNESRSDDTSVLEFTI